MKRYIKYSLVSLLSIPVVIFLLLMVVILERIPNCGPEVNLTYDEALKIAEKSVENYKIARSIPPDVKFKLKEVRRYNGTPPEDFPWTFDFVMEGYPKRQLYIMFDRTAKVERSLTHELGDYTERLRLENLKQSNEHP